MFPVSYKFDHVCPVYEHRIRENFCLACNLLYDFALSCSNYFFSISIMIKFRYSISCNPRYKRSKPNFYSRINDAKYFRAHDIYLGNITPLYMGKLLSNLSLYRTDCYAGYHSNPICQITIKENEYITTA